MWVAMLRTPAQPRASRRSGFYSVAAPTRGWIANENLYLSQPLGARVLENFRPTSTGIQPRGGSKRWATIGTVTESLMTYVNGPNNRLFAADETSIYDLTTIGSATTPPAPVVTGRTSGYYSKVQFTNSGGAFLIAVNGTDDALRFNGTSWSALNASSTPALTGAANLSAVWKYRNRLFFTNGTMSAWFLAINSIGGALSEIPLSGVFQKGGNLLFGATWSLDAGDGIDDKCVFVTTEGEFAVFEGSDPSTASDWDLVGRYDIAKPMGKNGFMQVGGDLLIETEDGIVPISMAINKDPAALSLSAVTRAIDPEWRKEVFSRRTLPWEIQKWPGKTLAVASLPITGNQDAYCFVVNLQTGAWAKYTGWDVRCLAVYQDQLYFGTSDGRVMQAEVGGNDDGMPYVCSYAGLPDHFNAPGQFKTIQSARATFVSGNAVKAKLSVGMDYNVNFPAAPASIDDFTTDVWDVGLWDVALWDAATVSRVSSRWVSIGRSGTSIVPQLQMTFGITPPPMTELVAIDFIYSVGGAMV